MGHLTPLLQEEIQRVVWELSVKERLNYNQIAQRCGISRDAVRHIVGRMREEMRQKRLEEGYDDLLDALQAQDEVIDEADRRLDELRPDRDSMMIPQLLQAKSQAGERKAKLLGLIQDKRKIDVQGSLPVEVTISFDRAFDRRQPLITEIVDAEITSG